MEAEESDVGIARHLRPEDWKIEINPLRVSGGIPTGLVLVYGHLLHPPFMISYEDNELHVNGIQIRPSLLRIRQLEAIRSQLPPPRTSSAGDDRDRIYTRAMELYSRKRVTLSHEESKQAVISYLKSEAKIRRVNWKSERILEVFLHSDLPRTLVHSAMLRENFQSPRQPSLPHLSDLQEHRRKAIREIEVGLERGDCFFVSHNVFRPDPRPVVNSIMSNPVESKAVKIRRIRKELSVTPNTALEILSNYDIEEWGVFTP